MTKKFHSNDEGSFVKTCVLESTAVNRELPLTTRQIWQKKTTGHLAKKAALLPKSLGKAESSESAISLSCKPRCLTTCVRAG